MQLRVLGVAAFVEQEVESVDGDEDAAPLGGLVMLRVQLQDSLEPADAAVAQLQVGVVDPFGRPRARRAAARGEDDVRAFDQQVGQAIEDRSDLVAEAEVERGLRAVPCGLLFRPGGSREFVQAIPAREAFEEMPLAHAARGVQHEDSSARLLCRRPQRGFAPLPLGLERPAEDAERVGRGVVQEPVRLGHFRAERQRRLVVAMRFQRDAMAHQDRHLPGEVGRPSRAARRSLRQQPARPAVGPWLGQLLGVDLPFEPPVPDLRQLGRQAEAGQCARDAVQQRLRAGQQASP